jgi:hypothetical protein
MTGAALLLMPMIRATIPERSKLNVGATLSIESDLVSTNGLMVRRLLNVRLNQWGLARHRFTAGHWGNI